MLRQLRFRTVVLVVQMSAAWRNFKNFSVRCSLKLLRKI